MRRLAKFLATVGGVGYCPVAPGTAGSLVGLLVGWAASSPASALVRVGGVLVGTWLAIAVSTRTERELGRLDPPVVVIDELVGMWLVLALLPFVRQSVWLMVAAFGLFRVFDIVKPFPLKVLARLPGGWGIVFDDLGASAYTCVIIGLMRVIAHKEW